jgi:hypothetical protein
MAAAGHAPGGNPAAPDFMPLCYPRSSPDGQESMQDAFLTDLKAHCTP